MARGLYRPIIIMAALAIAALSVSPVMARDKLTGEQRLSKMLEGRIAGKPVDCIPLFTGNEQQTVIDKTAIVYGWGDVIYVNRPTNPESLNSDDVMITHPTTDQNCSLDIVDLRDRTSHTYDGFVGLQQFVPWRRVKA